MLLLWRYVEKMMLYVEYFFAFVLDVHDSPQLIDFPCHYIIYRSRDDL